MNIPPFFRGSSLLRAALRSDAVVRSVCGCEGHLAICLEQHSVSSSPPPHSRRYALIVLDAVPPSVMAREVRPGSKWSPWGGSTGARSSGEASGEASCGPPAPAGEGAAEGPQQLRPPSWPLVRVWQCAAPAAAGGAPLMCFSPTGPRSRSEGGVRAPGARTALRLWAVSQQGQVQVWEWSADPSMLRWVLLGAFALHHELPGVIVAAQVASPPSGGPLLVWLSAESGGPPSQYGCCSVEARAATASGPPHDAVEGAARHLVVSECSVFPVEGVTQILVGRCAVWLVGAGTIIHHGLDGAVGGLRTVDCSRLPALLPAVHTLSGELLLLDQGCGALYLCSERAVTAPSLARTSVAGGAEAATVSSRSALELVCTCPAWRVAERPGEDGEVLALAAHGQYFAALTRCGCELFSIYTGLSAAKVRVERLQGMSGFWATGGVGQLGMWGARHLRCLQSVAVAAAAMHLAQPAAGAGGREKAARLCHPWGQSTERARSKLWTGNWRSSSLARYQNPAIPLALAGERGHLGADASDFLKRAVVQLQRLHAVRAARGISGSEAQVWHEYPALRVLTPLNAALDPLLSAWTAKAEAQMLLDLMPGRLRASARAERSSPSLSACLARADGASACRDKVLPPPLAFVSMVESAPSLATKWRLLFESILLNGAAFSALQSMDTCQANFLLFHQEHTCSSTSAQFLAFFEHMCRFYARLPDEGLVGRFVTFVHCNSPGFSAAVQGSCAASGSHLARALRVLSTPPYPCDAPDTTARSRLGHAAVGLLCTQRRFSTAVSLLLQCDAWGEAVDLVRSLILGGAGLQRVEHTLLFDLLLGYAAAHCGACALTEILALRPASHTQLQAIGVVRHALSRSTCPRSTSMPLQWLNPLLCC